MITSLIFRDNVASLYRVDSNNRILPVLTVPVESLPTEQAAQWSGVNAALQGLLGTGETIGDIVVDNSPGQVAASFATEQTPDLDNPGETMAVQVPATFRAVLNCNMTILGNDGSARQTAMTTEQFTSSDVRDALLALWSYLQTL